MSAKKTPSASFTLTGTPLLPNGGAIAMKPRMRVNGHMKEAISAISSLLLIETIN